MRIFPLTAVLGYTDTTNHSLASAGFGLTAGVTQPAAPCPGRQSQRGESKPGLPHSLAHRLCTGLIPLLLLSACAFPGDTTVPVPTPTPPAATPVSTGPHPWNGIRLLLGNHTPAEISTLNLHLIETYPTYVVAEATAEQLHELNYRGWAWEPVQLTVRVLYRDESEKQAILSTGLLVSETLPIYLIGRADAPTLSQLRQQGLVTEIVSIVRITSPTTPADQSLWRRQGIEVLSTTPNDIRLRLSPEQQETLRQRGISFELLQSTTR